MTVDDTSPERLEATITGVVQGVGFRWHVQRVASGLGLCGWVANMPNGDVAVVAEGARDRLAGLEQSLGSGPRGASVHRVDVRRAPATGAFHRFEIRSGSHPGD